MGQLTSVTVKKATRNRLKAFGIRGESFDDILVRLMDAVEESDFWDRQVQILREPQFHSIDEA